MLRATVPVCLHREEKLTTTSYAKDNVPKKYNILHGIFAWHDICMTEIFYGIYVNCDEARGQQNPNLVTVTNI